MVGRMNAVAAEDLLRRAKHFCDAQRYVTEEGCHVSSATLLDERVRDIGEIVVLSCSVDLLERKE